MGLHGYFVVELGQPPDSPTWASLFLSGPRTARVKMMQSPVHGEAAALVQRSPVVEELAPSRQQAAGMGVGGAGTQEQLGMLQRTGFGHRSSGGGGEGDAQTSGIRSWGGSGATPRWGGWSRFGTGGLCRWVEN